jgi:hypothetical protein
MAIANRDVCERISDLIDQEKVRLILPRTVIDEWNRHKHSTIVEEKKKRIHRMITDVGAISEFLEENDAANLKEILDRFQDQRQRIEDLALEEIRAVESLFSQPLAIHLAITEKVKLQAVDYALAKKPPFGSKNSMADALILLCAVDYIGKENLTNCIFVSGNTRDFSSRSDPNQIHEDLRELFDKHNIRYFSNVGLAVNEIEAELVSIETIKRIQAALQIDWIQHMLDEIREAARAAADFSAFQEAMRAMADRSRFYESIQQMLDEMNEAARAAADISALQETMRAMADHSRFYGSIQQMLDEMNEVARAAADISALQEARRTAAEFSAVSTENARLYSYVVRHDTGFAPNPFWNYCTLATCKPGIRKTAQPGDWIIGTGSVENVGSGKLIYAMQVAEVLPLEHYYSDPRFEAKKPVIKGNWRQRCGDNMYFKDDAGEWKRARSPYHTEPSEMEKDLRGRNVLIAEHFYYFGKNAVEIPKEYKDLVIVRGYKYRHNPETVRGFLDWLRTSFEPAIHGEPYDSPGCEVC